MKNGKTHSLNCKNEDMYYDLVEKIDNDERIDIIFDDKTISLRGGQVDYHEFEKIEENDDDDLYLVIDGKRYATQKLIDRLKKR